MDKCSKENIIEPRFIKLPKGPHDIAVDENTNTLYVSCKSSNLILVVDDTAGNDPIVKSINMKSPSQMQIDQNSKRLYVIGKDDGKIVDTETRDFVLRDDHKTSTFSARANGQMILDTTRSLAYIAQTGLASIEVVDVANGGRVKKVIGTKEKPTAIGLDSSANRIIVGNRRVELYVIDANSHRISDTIFAPEMVPKFSLLRHLADGANFMIPNFVYQRPKRILVNAKENRLYVIYSWINEQSIIPMASTPLDFDIGTWDECLTIFDATTYEMTNGIYRGTGLNEICINSINSQIYWFNSDDKQIVTLDKDGNLLQTYTPTPTSPVHNLFSQNQSLTWSGGFGYDAPLFQMPNIRLAINSALNKIYLTGSGKLDEYLLIYDLQKIASDHIQ